MREMSHARCVQRVCCSSWSCTPHRADCPSIDDWARPIVGGPFVGLGRAIAAVPVVVDVTVPRGRVELRNEHGQVVGHIGVPS